MRVRFVHQGARQGIELPLELKVLGRVELGAGQDQVFQKDHGGREH